MPDIRLSAAFLTLSCLAPPAGAEVVVGMAIKLPSGAEAQWIETRQDDSGGNGLTYRFRFVMPDLAQRVPSTSGPASETDDVLEEGGSVDIDTETGDVTISGAPAAVEPDADVTISTSDAGDAEADADEAEADAMLDDPALPAAPDVLAKDPVHEDVVWLCENWVLPRVVGGTPRPGQIVISISDKEVPFGAYDPDALQLFEAFRLPADRDSCQWEPW
ncbi:DUF6497 family protein [Paracoccus laeviglucosivorans]|uniref:Uncharacterized protein n=1 Tax=Paracoccus laeviglucosivorans TaxID=1197861 RepID=A0A521C831_9RHOB|nr:DUF6497 family protein [Paracoccus laeviglucosivorans]SMO55525.1 hypothetical protein SAMN06265221_10459 [Paracoccus laeviglucosivorans]